MTTLFLPEPALVVLIGAAGAGKSTFAARHFAADEILSSDALRAAIGGDEANQAVSGAAFAALHRSLERRLAQGATTVVDATNATASDRRELLRRARRVGVPAVALALDLPRAVVLARNAGRRRQVDPDVIDRQLARVRETLARDLTGEGFASVWVGRSVEEVEAVEIRRVPAMAAPPAPPRASR